ncbi:GNAT family N-acetyltransferase, partial [Nostocoides australiense]
MAFSRLADGTTDIERLVVDPEHLRRGLGRALVERAARGPAVVATGRANRPARRLYGGSARSRSHATSPRQRGRRPRRERGRPRSSRRPPGTRESAAATRHTKASPPVGVNPHQIAQGLAA